MQAKQYLKKAKRINSFIKAKEEELEMLRLKASSIGSMNFSADKVQSTPNPSKLHDDVIAIAYIIGEGMVDAARINNENESEGE